MRVLATYLSSHPLVKRFLQGVRRQWPVLRAPAGFAAGALVSDFYEPIEHSLLKTLSFKTALLLDLC